MLFNSYEFVFGFVPIVLIGAYFLAGRGQRRLSVAWLVGMSLFFYGWWNPAFLGLIIGSVVFNFLVGSYLARHRLARGTKLALAGGILANLGAIGYFKYAGFFVSVAGHVIGASWAVPGIVLPLAISFFTFQQIAYLVDAYRGETEEHDLLNYFLFVTFFPQLIAGPIVHHREMMPQFLRPGAARLRANRLAVGFTIFAIGLFKKVIIADGVAGYVTPVFAAADRGVALHFLEAWSGVLSYSFQIYFDFSGYSDMAVGLAQLFGIRLPINFFSPYKADSIVEFWRRWHISLSRFLRDYLYIPLGGKRAGIPIRYRNILITMLLGGLWHGAGWTFVIWGGLHGLYICVNHAWRYVKRRLGFPSGPLASWTGLPSRFLTFLAVTVAWVFFRAETLDGALVMLEAMASPGNLMTPMHDFLVDRQSLFTAFGPSFNFLLLFLLLGAVWFLPNTYELMVRYQPAIDSYGHLSGTAALRSRFVWRMSWGWAVTIGLVAALTVFGLGNVTEFLYFRF